MISQRTWTGLGVGALCASAVLAALMEMLLVPLYSGRTLVPITILFAIASNVAIPLLARELVPTSRWRVVPFAAWVVTVLIIGVFPRPEGDIILPGGGGVEWVGWGVLLGGAIAGTVTAVFTVPVRPPRVPPAASTPPSQPVNG